MNNILEQEFLSEKNTFTLFNMFQKSVKAKLEIDVGKEYFDKMIEIMEELCDIDVDSLQKVNKMVLQKTLNYLNEHESQENSEINKSTELSGIQSERMSLINKRPQVSYVPRKEVKIPVSNQPEFIARNNKVENTNQINNTMDNFEKLLMNRNQNGRDKSTLQNNTISLPKREIPGFSGQNNILSERKMPTLESKPFASSQMSNTSTNQVPLTIPDRKMPTLDASNKNAVGQQELMIPKRKMPVLEGSLKQSAFPSQPGAFPPQQGAFPPQQGAFPPQQGDFPPQQRDFPPQPGPLPPQPGTLTPQLGTFPSKPGALTPPQDALLPQQAISNSRNFPPNQNSLSPNKQENTLKVPERKMPILEPPKRNYVQPSNQKIIKLPNRQIPIDDKKELENNVKQAEKKISTIMNNRAKPIVEKKYVLLDSRKRNTELYPECNSYVYKLPREYKSVSSLQLISGRIPEINYNCMGLEITILGDNPVYIKIDPGTYETEEIVYEFQKRLPTCEISGLKKNKILIRNLDDKNLDIETEIEFERIDDNTVIFQPFVEQDSYLELHISNLKFKTQMSDKPSCIAQLYYPSETNVIHIAPKIKLTELVDISELEISFKRWNGELVNFHQHQHLLTFQFV